MEAFGNLQTVLRRLLHCDQRSGSSEEWHRVATSQPGPGKPIYRIEKLHGLPESVGLRPTGSGNLRKCTTQQHSRTGFLAVGHGAVESVPGARSSAAGV